MNSGGQPRHNFKLCLLSFVSKVILTEHRAWPASQECEPVKLFFRDSPAIGFGLPFIPAVHDERRNAHHSD